MADLTRDGVLDLYARLRQTWATRNGEYDTARMRYLGEHWDATNPEPVNRYSLTLNYLKPFVDKSVQLLVGRMPALQVMPPGTDEPARRLAEQLEGVLYGTYDRNNAPEVLQKVAWDSFVLRRGLMYVWWDPDTEMVRFRECAPEHFFPEYDGNEMFRCVYVQRRSTDALRDQYPEYADQIVDDRAMDVPIVAGSAIDGLAAPGQTTVIDVYTREGQFFRSMGKAFISLKLDLPFKRLPFIEFPCFPVSGDTEPLNSFDQIVELNQYLDQLVSQQADIIAKYANPVVKDMNSGQGAEAIRKAMGAPGAVIPIKRDGDIQLLGWNGNIPAIQEQVTFILDAMFDLAGKPRSAFGQTITNQSGVVTNLALTPTLQSNEFHESIWGTKLSELNEWILALWEKNKANDLISFRGRKGLASGSTRYYEVELTGAEIGGWYKNRIKWPSAIRTDDPVYVQNLLQQLTASVPGISLYTYLEEMGHEDVEAEIDRIQQQLEDPRLHPERLKSAMDVASTIAGGQLPPAFADLAGGPGGPPAAGGAPSGAAPLAASLQAAGNPNMAPMAQAAKPSGY